MKMLKNQSGIAMLMALSTMVILGILAAELVYETEVYHGMVFQQRDQLRAKLLVKSALKLAKLQLKATQLARDKSKSFGDVVSADMIEKIWQTPLIFPPPAPPGLSEADKGSLEKFKTSLGFDGLLTVNISGESDRLNLNQLVLVSKEQLAAAAAGGTGGSGSNPAYTGGTVIGATGAGAGGAASAEQKKAAMNNTKQAFVDTLVEIIDQKKKSDDKFREQYATLNPDSLIGNLVAWMDPDTKLDGDNRDKEDYYSRLDPSPYAIKNSPLASESELYMVKGFDDTLVNLFAEHFTVQTTTSVDINKASLTLLKALIKELDPIDLERIQKRRSDPPPEGGPFAKADDFWKFLGSDKKFDEAKQRLTKQGIKILEPESSYRVVVTGRSGNVVKTWTALIGAPPPEAGAKPAAATTPAVDQPAKPAADPTKDTKKNDPDSLRILYLKAE